MSFAFASDKEIPPFSYLLKKDLSNFVSPVLVDVNLSTTSCCVKALLSLNAFMSLPKWDKILSNYYNFHQNLYHKSSNISLILGRKP